jgi:hypothetical protein
MTSKIRKKELPPCAVICDTNVLWSMDKGLVCNPEFEKFWETCSAAYNLKLYIPDTVLGELMFQHTTSALKSFNSIDEHLKKLTAITEKDHHTRSTPESIKSQIHERFDRWLHQKKGEVIPLPVAGINLKELANKAVWHLPPFTLDSKNPELEKGFRDALIMETVCGFSNADAERSVAFICFDALLREATTTALALSFNFNTYESLSDFESYLRLTKETFTKKFIAEIQIRAKEKFWASDGDLNCFYYEGKVRETLQETYKDYFADLTKSKNALSLIHDAVSTWEPVNSGQYWIHNPEFISIQDNHRYVWKSMVRFVRPYRRLAISSPFEKIFQNIPPEFILILPFHITWSARVKKDARFYDMKVEKTDLVGNEFRAPTQDEKVRYSLVPKPSEEDL